MTRPLSQLEQLIGDLSASTSQESDLLLLQLDEASADRLRLCAIPHTFDADVLRALDPRLSAEEVEQTLEEFQKLPAVMQVADCLALHDVVRQQLFAQWLVPERRQEFSTASRRLVELYRPRADESTSHESPSHRSWLFHLLGADLEAGFREFRAVYQARRDLGRFSECEALVRLLREYEPVLGPNEWSWFTFYQAEVADDNRNLAQAAGLYDAVLKRVISDELRARALLRSASVLRRLGQFEPARARCAEAVKSGAAPHLIHHELGLIARDGGEAECARTEFERSIELAKAISSRRDVVLALNSLGTLLLKLAPREAASLFRECLGLLDRETDTLRVAQVLNNLAMANADIQEWPASELYFEQSLQIKRASRDVHGEASTLLNVARVYRVQQKWDQALDALVKSASLFESAHDTTRAGQAQRELARLMRVSGREAEVEHYARTAIDSMRRAGNDDEAKAITREFGIRDAADARRRRRFWMVLIGGVAIAIAVIVILAST